VPGSRNSVADAMSRLSNAPQPTDDVPEGGIHPHDYLAPIKVEELLTPAEMSRRDPSRKRRRNLRCIDLTALQATIDDFIQRPVEDNNDGMHRRTISHARLAPIVDADGSPETENDEERLIDEDTERAQQEIDNNVGPQINLTTQSDSRFSRQSYDI
jgi:hypothetical protein